MVLVHAGCDLPLTNCATSFNMWQAAEWLYHWLEEVRKGCDRARRDQKPSPGLVSPAHEDKFETLTASLVNSISTWEAGLTC